MITGTQIRMARAALGWSVHVLAEKAGVTANTVSRIERGGESLSATLDNLQTTLERGGVIFLPADQNIDGGAGVRLRKD